MLNAMNVREDYLYRLGILYLAIPLVIFISGWLRFPFMCLAVLLLWSLYRFLRGRGSEGEERGYAAVSVSYRQLFFLLAIFFLWCFFSGIGGMWFQSSDFRYRNAVLRDLVNYGWPVVYENGSFLCYYFGFWLIPALFGKLVLWLGGTAALGFAVADKVLLVWTWLGVVLTALLLMVRMKVSSWRPLLLLVGVFIGFSGVDILMGAPDGILYPERWNGVSEFSSDTAVLFWVFNQGVPAWLGTVLVMSRDDVRFDGIVCAFTAFLAPLPAFGLLGIIAFKFCLQYRKGRIRKEILTVRNLSALLFILPVVLFFFENTRTGKGTLHFFWQRSHPDSFAWFMVMILFFVILFALIEYMPYLWAVYPEEKHSWLFKALCVLLLVISVVQLGDSKDFAMRVSIPPLFCLMMLVLKHLKAGDLPRVRGFALALIFSIGCFTPALEFARGGVSFYTHGGVVRTTERFYSFSNLDDGDENFNNFMVSDYKGCRFRRLIGRD